MLFLPTYTSYVLLIVFLGNVLNSYSSRPPPPPLPPISHSSSLSRVCACLCLFSERISISPQLVPISQLVLLGVRALQKLEDKQDL